MKYSEYSSEKKGNSAFYIILTICLLVIGIAAWFAFSNIADATPDTNSSIDDNQSSKTDEYNDNNSSYNNSTDKNNSKTESGIENVIPSEPTADELEDVPYTPPVVEKSYTMPINGDVLKDFSTTTLQYSQTYGDMRIHQAVDIACKEGTVVTACTDGTIQSVEKSATLGTVITIDHGDNLIVKYAALNNVTLKSGNKVKNGDNLGTVATVPCECADQSHLHIEAYKDSKPISILSLFQ